jgi:hypothetical protein
MDASDCWDFEYSQLADALRIFRELPGMKPFCQPLLDVLIEPERMADLPLEKWDLLIRQARQAGLLVPPRAAGRGTWTD